MDGGIKNLMNGDTKYKFVPAERSANVLLVGGYSFNKYGYKQGCISYLSFDAESSHDGEIPSSEPPWKIYRTASTEPWVGAYLQNDKKFVIGNGDGSLSFCSFYNQNDDGIKIQDELFNEFSFVIGNGDGSLSFYSFYNQNDEGTEIQDELFNEFSVGVHNNAITSISVQDTGSIITGSKDRGISVWNVSTQVTEIFYDHAHLNWITGIKSLNDQETGSGTKSAHLFSTSSLDGDVVLWDVRLENPATKIFSGHVGCTSIDWHVLNTTIFIARENGSVVVADIRKPLEPLEEMQLTDQPISRIKSKKNRLALLNCTNCVQVFTYGTEDPFTKTYSDDRHSDLIQDIAWTGTDKLISCGADGKVLSHISSLEPTKEFPYEIGDVVALTSDESIWSLHMGKKKSTGEEVSIFVFDVRNSPENRLEIAKNAIRRLKMLRHPSILTYLDSHESDKALLLATERVEPLSVHLAYVAKDNRERDLYLSWGIFQVTRALSFLNNDGNLRHNNVCMLSVFVNSAGEWKLGSVEHTTSLNEGDGVPIKILTALDKYSPPEKADAIKQRHITKCSTDMWGLGCLIWEVYNGQLPQQSALRNSQKIPKSLVGVYSELISSSPNSRPNPADVITRCRKNDGFFKNDLVDSLLFLEEIQIKEKSEKNRFFSSLTTLLDHFPDNVCRYKILPHLINAYEYGDAGAAVLTPLLKLGNLLEDSEYQKKIVPCVVKLFNCNDRATRSKLLQQLEHYIGHLQTSTINDQIFPQIANGFLDSNAMIREQTIKSVIHLSPKLNYNNLNVEILRHFARLQSKDEQGGIRTNTTVCLGKIAQHLHPQIRQKVLISAFIRAMRDPFPPARTAGILALAATQQYFLMSEVASRILPALCQLAIDPDKSVRDHVFRTIKGFLGKLEKLSEDPTLRESMEADVHASTPSLSNAAATWAGWAVTAVTAKFYRSQSDITKPTTPRISKNINKPCSLEMPPSSSSMSTTTTTSEVTSLGSFEQEDRALDSVSDYEENWENESWGDIQADEKIQTTLTTAQPNGGLSNNAADGWDDEDWSPIEENVSHVSQETSKVADSSAWERANWNTMIDETPENTEKPQDDKKIREERRQQRQKELEMKKVNKRSGITKLGAKKI